MRQKQIAGTVDAVNDVTDVNHCSPYLARCRPQHVSHKSHCARYPKPNFARATAPKNSARPAYPSTHT
jgi:hypothetical protein